jgi:hypothetical protein
MSRTRPPISDANGVPDLAATSPRPFDSFVLAGNNLGLLGGRAAAPVFLEALSKMAAPGARIIGESTDPYATTDAIHLDYHERNRAAGRLGGQLNIRIRHRRQATHWFDYLLCTPEELADLVRPTRWELVGTHRYPTAGGSPAASWVAVLALR